MLNLHIREEKIKAKRKSTTWRDFLMEIGSRCPLNFYKINNKVSRYPDTPRVGKLTTAEEFVENGDGNMPQIDININDNFLKQLDTLRSKIEKPQRWVFGDVEDSEYADTIGIGAKSCYLTICGGVDIQNVLYSFYVITKCSDIYNSVAITNGSQNIYQGVGINKSYNIFYSRYIYNSSNIWFCTNMQGCVECILCDKLNNKSYCIKNKQYTKEEYFKEKEEILKRKEIFLTYFKKLEIISENIGSTDSVGGSIMYSENIENGLFVNQVRNGRNLIVVGNGDKVEEQYDCLTSATQGEHGYGNMGVSPGSFMYCSMNSGDIDHIFYCVYVWNCHHCIGCYGLKNKSYCIFNKQYTKEERYVLANKIFQQMDSDGTLGSFFPASMNPFYFNDTIAYLIDDSFTKKEVTAQGYLRRDDEIKVDVPAGADVIETKDLNNYQGFNKDKGEREINPEILKKIIKDDKGNYYKIVPMELEFLQKYGLPLPEIHWLDRIKLGFKFK